MDARLAEAAGSPAAMGDRHAVDRRPLGRTGIELSLIGFGAFKIGRNQGIKYAQGYELPAEVEVSRLLNGVLDLGINYIDTAPAYGLSEERIGQAIAGRKSDFIISTKVGETFEYGKSQYDFTAVGIERSLARSCERLRVDVLDLVFIHSDGNDEHILRSTEAVSALRHAREAGRVRAIGFSGKTADGARASLDWADAIMVEYHLNDASHDQVMKDANERGVGVIVKKGLASGRLPPEQAIPFVLAHPAVTSMVIGGLNLQHIESNLRYAEQKGAG
jgi:aryl-alcohol dehydrogenase-like predicted oxidoreductase